MTEDRRYCGLNHHPEWKITYDIGKNTTEHVLVCKACYENPEDDSFRLFVVSKVRIEGDGGCSA